MKYQTSTDPGGFQMFAFVLGQILAFAIAPNGISVEMMVIEFRDPSSEISKGSIIPKRYRLIQQVETSLTPYQQISIASVIPKYRLDGTLILRPFDGEWLFRAGLSAKWKPEKNATLLCGTTLYPVPRDWLLIGSAAKDERNRIGIAVRLVPKKAAAKFLVPKND
jgi:hypothetical protein